MNLIRFIFYLCTLTNYVYCYKDTYDVILFVQRWYESACIIWKGKKSDNECIKTTVDGRSWIIHGIWPTKLHNKNPSPVDCPSKSYSEKELVAIKNDLNKFWPNIQTQRSQYNSKKMNTFWSHEWKKHGSCLYGEPNFKSIYDYFNKGLEWLKLYNMYTILATKQIKPSLDLGYNINNIRNAIKDQIHVNPILKCYKDKKSKKIIINEIRICFHKNLTLADCDGVEENVQDNFLTNCKTNSLVYYFNPSKGYALSINTYLIIIAVILVKLFSDKFV